MKNINRGQRYIILASIQGYILFDRMDRVQIGPDCITIEQAIDRRNAILRNLPGRA